MSEIWLPLAACRYRQKPSNGGLRPKMLKLDGWLQLMGDAGLIDGQFTLQDANLCFLWSRMLVVDEIKDYQRCEQGASEYAVRENMIYAPKC